MGDSMTKQDRRRFRNATDILTRVLATIETLREFLAEIPVHVAIIDAMGDEAARRSALVVVRDTTAKARTLVLELRRTIHEVEQWLGERVPVSANSATPGTTAGPLNRLGGPDPSALTDSSS